MTNMTHKWNEDATLMIVEEYRQHECLYKLITNYYNITNIYPQFSLTNQQQLHIPIY